MSDKDLFGDIADDGDESDALYREDQDALFAALAEVIEERDLEPDEIVPLLIDAVYHYRALAYVITTPKPSESGFRTDLDRLHKMLVESHREYRKSAGTAVRSLSAAIAAMDRVAMTDEEAAADGDGEGKPPGVLSDGTGR
jgi:hypothetical protein